MSNREFPMMPWFPQDFAGATSAWAFAERALYRELLDAQWILGRLPTDEKRLARIARMDAVDFDAAWEIVKTKFVVVNGCFINKRLEDHRTKAQRLHEQRMSASRASAQTRRERAVERPDSERSSARRASREHPSPSPSVEEKNTSSPTARSTHTGARLPNDFALTEVRRSIAVAEHLDPERTFAKFTDHWRAATGSKARKLDWDATWRNWCRTDADRNGASNGTHRQRREPRTSALERVRLANADALDDDPGGTPRRESLVGNG